MIGYRVQLPAFEGPLALLLSLIERRELDITTISLARVTDQFLEYLRSGEGITPEVLADFVVVAAKLLLIKSLALLPRPTQGPAPEVFEDPTDLTQRLREYRVFREAGFYLRGRQDAGLRSHPCVPANGHAPAGQASRALGRQPAEDLRQALIRLLVSRQANESSIELPRDEWTVVEAIDWLLTRALSGQSDSFQSLLAGASRSRIITAFLALLELHRLGRLAPNQDRPFGEIGMRAADGQPNGAFTLHTPSLTAALTGGP